MCLRSQQGQYLGKDAGGILWPVLATAPPVPSQSARPACGERGSAVPSYTCSQKRREETLPPHGFCGGAWGLPAVPRAHEVCQGLSYLNRVETNVCLPWRHGQPLPSTGLSSPFSGRNKGSDQDAAACLQLCDTLLGKQTPLKAPVPRSRPLGVRRAPAYRAQAVGASPASPCSGRLTSWLAPRNSARQPS